MLPFWECVSVGVVTVPWKSPGNYYLGFLGISGSPGEDMGIRIMGLREEWEVGVGITAESLMRLRRLGIQVLERIAFCWNSDDNFFLCYLKELWFLDSQTPCKLPSQWNGSKLTVCKEVVLSKGYGMGLWQSPGSYDYCSRLSDWGFVLRSRCVFSAPRSRAAPAVNAPQTSCPSCLQTLLLMGDGRESKAPPPKKCFFYGALTIKPWGWEGWNGISQMLS